MAVTPAGTVGGSVKRTDRVPWLVCETWLTVWVWELDEVCNPGLEMLLVDEADVEVLFCCVGLGSRYTDPTIAASAIATASAPAVTT